MSAATSTNACVSVSFAPWVELPCDPAAAAVNKLSDTPKEMKGGHAASTSDDSDERVIGELSAPITAFKEAEAASDSKFKAASTSICASNDDAVTAAFERAAVGRACAEEGLDDAGDGDAEAIDDAVDADLELTLSNPKSSSKDEPIDFSAVTLDTTSSAVSCC